MSLKSIEPLSALSTYQQKTRWPAYYIPSLATMTHDVKQVFVKSKQRIAMMLQVRGFIKAKLIRDTTH